MTLSSVLNLNQSIDMTFRYMYFDFLKGNIDFFCKLLYKHTKQTLIIHVYQFSWDKTPAFNPVPSLLIVLKKIILAPNLLFSAPDIKD